MKDVFWRVPLYDMMGLERSDVRYPPVIGRQRGDSSMRIPLVEPIALGASR